MFSCKFCKNLAIGHTSGYSTPPVAASVIQMNTTDHIIFNLAAFPQEENSRINYRRAI